MAFSEFVKRQKPDATAVDGDVSRIAFVEVYGSVHGGNAHVVSVRAYARRHAHVHVFGVFHARGKLRVIII